MAHKREDVYVIVDSRTGKFWNAGVCNRDNVLEATTFFDKERHEVTLYGELTWRKL